VLPDDDDDSAQPNDEPQKKTKTMDNDQQLQRAIQVLQNKDKKAS
jgi:hypothetical protein